MNAKKLGWVLGSTTLVGAGGYLMIYLYRWEWNRALTAGLFVLIAEVALAAAAIMERLRAMEARLARPAPVPTAAGTDRALRALRHTAPPGRDHFAWLAPRTDQLGVFVPVLMGAGAVLSGLAWLIERLARRTARPVLEHKLAARLGALSLPDDGLVAPPSASPAPGTGLALLLAPRAPVAR